MDHPFRGLGPVLLLAPPLLLGFFLGLGAGPVRSALAAVLLLASLLLVLLVRAPAVSALSIMALCGVLAAGRLPLPDPEEVRPFLGREAVLRGRLLQVGNTDAGWRGVVEGAEVLLPDGSGSIRMGNVLLSVWNPDAAVSFPAEVRATGILAPVRSRGNPGETPREWTALAECAPYRFSADASRTVFLPMGGSDGGLMGVFRRARARTGRWIDAHAGDTDGALYLRAVTTGEVPPPSHPMVALLRKTGLSHLLAISGVHVVLFFTAHSFLARCTLWAIRRGHGAPDLNRVSAFLSLPVCWAYAMMAGSPVSAIRAAGMLTVVVLLWNLLGVRGSGVAWTALFLGTIVHAPFRVFSPSFLLSYGASFFLIAAFAGKERNPLPGAGALRKATGWARNALVGSTMAFLGTLPVSAAFFGMLPAAAILWNVLFLPVLGTVGVAGALLGAAGGAFSIEALGVPVRFAAEALTVSLSVLARASGNGAWCFPLPPAGTVAPVVFTGAAAAGSLLLRKRGREPWPAVAAGGIAFLLWIHLPYAALPDRHLTVAALNVGKGASHVVSFPYGGHMLIDCGSLLRGDAGGRIVLPYLRGRGIRRIDVLVLTHPHEDHYGGAESVLASVPVGEIWIPEGISPSAYGKFLEVRPDRIRWKSGGDRFGKGGAEVVVRGAGGQGDSSGANEKSLVLEIRHGAFSAWLPGDVERGPSAWGYDTGVTGGERVLFLPHHGSPGAFPGLWIRAAAPRVVISQNSDCFKGGNLLPSPQSFFLENGAVTMRTDGHSVFIDQERRSSLWNLFLRQPLDV